MERKIRYLLLIILSVLLMVLVKIFSQTSYLDFTVYYNAAITVREGGSIYQSAGPGMSYLYAPLTIFIFLPLSIFPLCIAEKLWLLFSFCLFTLAWCILLNKQHIPWNSLQGLWLSVAVVAFFPFKFTLAMGQINMLTFFCLVLFFTFYKTNNHISGFFLAMAMYIKISPVLFIVYLLYRRDLRTVYVVLVTLLVMSILSLFIYPTATQMYLVTILPSISTAIPTDYYNQALSGFFGRMLVSGEIVTGLRYVSVCVIVSITAVFFKKLRRPNYQLEMSTILPISLLISSFSWQHHFVLLLISYVLLISALYSRNYSARFFYSVLVLLVISFMLVGYNIKQPGLVSYIGQSHVLYGTILLWILHLVVLKKNDEKITP